VTGLPIPADAEIVMEGWVDPDEREVEGPFGEWTGYYASLDRPEPVFRVEAIYFRNDPIILASPPNVPPDEQSFYRAFMRSARLRGDLEAASIPGIVGVWCHEVGGSRIFDATRPWEWLDKFPLSQLPTPATKKKALDRWGWLVGKGEKPKDLP